MTCASCLGQFLKKLKSSNAPSFDSSLSTEEREIDTEASKTALEEGSETSRPKMTRASGTIAVLFLIH